LRQGVNVRFISNPPSSHTLKIVNMKGNALKVNHFGAL